MNVGRKLRRVQLGVGATRLLAIMPITCDTPPATSKLSFVFLSPPPSLYSHSRHATDTCSQICKGTHAPHPLLRQTPMAFTYALSLMKPPITSHSPYQMPKHPILIHSLLLRSSKPSESF